MNVVRCKLMTLEIILGILVIADSLFSTGLGYVSYYLYREELFPPAGRRLSIA
jgi:hypothetical protein